MANLKNIKHAIRHMQILGSKWRAAKHLKRSVTADFLRSHVSVTVCDRCCWEGQKQGRRQREGALLKPVKHGQSLVRVVPRVTPME